MSGKEQLLGCEAKVTVDEEGKLWVMLEGERWQCRCAEHLHTGQLIQVIAVKGKKPQQS